jgi:hypothetical protein
VVLGVEGGNLEQVLTSNEATSLWGLEISAVRKSKERDKFMCGNGYDEVRKTVGTRLFLYRAMQRVYGCVPLYNYKK